MHKRTIKIVLLVLILAAAFSFPAFAAESRANQYIDSTWAYIEKNGNGKITIYFSVNATDTMTTLGASRIRLYKEDGTVAKTFLYTNDDYSDMVTSNNCYYESSVTYNGKSGERYYAVVTFYAKNNSGSSTVSYTTATITA